MKLRPHFIAFVFALLFAGSARGQNLDTGWIPSSGAYEDSGNWSGDQPNIARGYFNNFEDFGNQYAGIDNGGTALVTTADTTSATADQLFVGVTNGHSGNLTVQDGGILTVHSLTIGSSAGSTGYVTVTGTNSQITGPGAAILVGAYGAGSLTISSGGTVDISMTVGWQTSSAGTVLVTGADSSAVRLTGGSGTATITVTDQAQVTNYISGGSGTTDITVSNYASVGTGINGGYGSVSNTHVTITDHASVSGGITSSLISTPGDMDITVSDSATVSGGINLFGGGTNSFTINTGGALIDGGISLTASGSAAGTIDGGSHTVDSDIYVSGTGSNTLTLQNNATMDASAVSTTVGDGDGQNGALIITNGATLTTGNAYVGSQSGSYGEVTVSGSGSDLHVSGEFVVGSGGSGNLTVSSGGSLHTDSDAYIGYFGSGSVTVTSGAQWTSGGDVHLANSLNSSGSLTLTDGGFLSVNGGFGTLHLNTEAGGFGTLNIGGDGSSSPAIPGLLSAATITGSTSNGGVAVLVFNHTDNAYFFDPQITGGVNVVQKHGTTILTGTNDYSGGTTIMGGTLALGHDNALGTGDIIMDGGTLDLNIYNQTSGLLNVLGNSFIDFSGTNTLVFADSSGITWSGTLTLLDFGAGDVFQVGGNANGLTSTQLSLIDIDGYIAMIDGDGFLSKSGTAFTAPAVPEPSTYAMLAGLAALGLAAGRRRFTALRLKA